MDDESASKIDARIGGLVDERYRVLEAMAAGSMGAVYKAERVPVGKLVAIKFLHAPFANDSEFLSRFERETRVMSKLTHPNCVSVVDFGVWDGSPYLVMEYVSGTTLRALIDQGPLPPKRALALVRQIAAGLAHAHAQGVVHRDVKPANIMISEEIATGDHVRILDFGLARLRGAVGRDATQSNIVVGTPNYMAPEQTVGGGLIDARTDIYAVGVVLFEMICGDRPFHAEDTLALLGMHRAAPIPKLADRIRGDAKLPRGLQDVVDKAMAKSPGDRFQSAIELAEAIDEVASAPLVGASGALRSADAKRAAAMAPTMLDFSDAAELVAPAARGQAKPRGNFLGSLIFLAILAGGVTAAVLWIKDRSADTKSTSGSGAPLAQLEGGQPAPTQPTQQDGPDSPTERRPDSKDVAAADGSGQAAPAPQPAGSASPASEPAAGSASTAPLPPGAGSDSLAPAAVVPPGSGSDVAAPPGEAAAEGSGGSPAEPPPAPTEPAPAASPAATKPDAPCPDGSPCAEIELDPATAEDPAPPSAKPARNDDEAANAPKTAAEVARRAPPPSPTRGTTLDDAVRLIKEGKRELAFTSLNALWKKTPNSSYIPFLLGNLYYDQRWWSVAMDHYEAAIKKNAKYRSNPVLNRNVIGMLASDKTARRAQGFLKYIVGKPALPFVKYAAKHDAHPQIRRRATWLVNNL